MVFVGLSAATPMSTADVRTAKVSGATRLATGRSTQSAHRSIADTMCGEWHGNRALSVGLFPVDYNLAIRGFFYRC